MSARGHATRTHDRITESTTESIAERTGSPAMTGPWGPAWGRAWPLLASGQCVAHGNRWTAPERGARSPGLGGRREGLSTACQPGVPDGCRS